MEARKGERPPDSRSRSRRFLQTQEGWFFKTRENIAVGPYPSEFDAEVSASLLIARLAQLDDQTDMTTAIHDFLSDPTDGPRRTPNQTPVARSWDKLVKDANDAEPSIQSRLVDLWGKTRSMLSGEVDSRS